MSFDMNRTWSHSVALVRANFQLLAVIAGVFVLLPTLLTYFAFPDLLRFSDPATAPNLDSEKAWSVIAGFFGVMIVLVLFQLAGQAAMIALLGGRRPTVGEAIGRGLKALPTIIGMILLIFLLMVLATVAVALVIALLGVVLVLIAGKAAATVIAVLTYGVVILGGLYFWARLCMILPVIVLDAVHGPLAVLKRSWSLTRAVAWRIAGFFVLLGIAYLIVSLVIYLALGALGLITLGTPSGGAVLGFSIASGVIGAAVTMLIAAILVSMHRQLAGGTQAEFEFGA